VGGIATAAPRRRDQNYSGDLQRPRLGKEPFRVAIKQVNATTAAVPLRTYTYRQSTKAQIVSLGPTLDVRDVWRRSIGVWLLHPRRFRAMLWSRDVARWFRWNRSVAGPFVCRCLTIPAMLPFPHPAHRTGRADLPHPALGESSRNRHSHRM
jgi:hypothetical protein